jgi:Animal haem peroxidase
MSTKKTPGASKKQGTMRGSRKSAIKRQRSRPGSAPPLPGGEHLPEYVKAQLRESAQKPSGRRNAEVSPEELGRRARNERIPASSRAEELGPVIRKIDPDARVPLERLPEQVQESIKALTFAHRGLHGAKLSLAWFPWPSFSSRCADKFGYLTPPLIRASTRLPFNTTSIGLLDQLGMLMGDPGRDANPDSPIPAGFTYVGQFVDHDITFDVSSPLDALTDANIVNNMRTPALDLDSLYGRGPALDAFMYAFPTSGPSTAIKLQLGSNQNVGTGGPAGASGNPGGMVAQTSFDVPRIHNPTDPASSTLTAVIGDPRNDENLIVSQFHHAMLRLHNRVVDTLVLAGFSGDIFVEAKRIVTHHYQWAVVHDFLGRICGTAAVTAALSSVTAPIGSAFRMPVEFAVAAYRFGHSMIRDTYWVNFNFPTATLGQVFDFIRKPRIPVLSSWVVDFNAFFDTGFPVPVNNKARKIDSVLASGLEALPGLAGMMAVLAQRNLRRGLALGLPSGQGVAKFFGVPPLTAAQLVSGLPPNEVLVLNQSGKLLLKKTPLWYYVLRESMVLHGGDQLGPVGGRIVAETFARMLKRDAMSYLNVSGGFTPILTSAVPGDFTFADLLNFAGVTQP